MARGRIFSSRRMFSTRRSSFAEPSKQSGPLGVMLGLSAAAIIIFVVGVFVGRSMPQTAATPVVLGEPVAPFAVGASEAPAKPEVFSDVTPDATPKASSSDARELAPAPAPSPAPADALSNSPLTESPVPASEPVAATEH